MKQLVLLILIFSFALPAQMQAQRRVERQSFSAEKPSRLKPEQKQYIKQRHEILRQKLQLTPSQQSTLKALRKQTRDEIEKVKNDSRLTPAEKKKQLDRLIQEAKNKRNSVLTPSQQIILEKEMEFRKNNEEDDW